MKILHQAKSPYNKIKVVEEDGIRKLICGTTLPTLQSAIDLEDLDRDVCHYSALMMGCIDFIPNLSRILVVGLGGGTVVRRLLESLPDAAVDVIEIDEQITELAKEYFYLEDNPRMRIVTGNAFNVIPTLQDQYDIIILDAFIGNTLPIYLMSTEFFDSVTRRLKESSMVVSNLWSTHPSYARHLKTLCHSFGDDIYAAESSDDSVSVILFNLRGEIKIPDQTVFSKLDLPEEAKSSEIVSLKR